MTPPDGETSPRFNARVAGLFYLLTFVAGALIGYLVYRSNFLPRIIGVLMAIGGLGWQTNSFVSFLSPPLARSLSSSMMAPGILGEAALTLWLLVMGVKRASTADALS